jgi:hypothetical protein
MVCTLENETLFSICTCIIIATQMAKKRNVTTQMDYMEALTAAAGAQAATMLIADAPPYDTIPAALVISAGTAAAIIVATTLSAGSEDYSIQVDTSDALYAAVLVGVATYFGGNMAEDVFPAQVDWLVPAAMGFAGALVAQKFPKIPILSDLFKKD